MNLLRTAFLLAGMTALTMGIGYLIGGQIGMTIALLIAGGMNFFSWWNSGSMVLRMHNASEVDARSAPDLVTMVANLAERADLPMPKVYLLETDQPNAFATGRNPENAAVAVSQGLLDRMSQEEIAAVMAHELAHIKNHDTLTMTVTATLAGAISMLANFAFFFRGGRDNPLGFIGTLAAMMLAPMAASIVQLAISRTREYSADKLGSEICGNPLWLASALEKISKYAGRIDNEAAEAAPATAHMFIINPLNGRSMDNLFSTHPDTGNRIAALQELAAEWRQGEQEPVAQTSAQPSPPETEIWGRRAGKTRQRSSLTQPWGNQTDRSDDDSQPGPWGNK